MDLFPEFQGVGDFLEDFGGSAGAADNDRAIAEHSAQRRLFYRDTFNSRQEQLDSAPACQAGLYDHSLISQRHFGGVALDEADYEENCCDNK